MSSYLEERIRWYDDNYRSGNALISDAQFDQLENNLKRVSPNCDYFTNKKLFHFLPFLKIRYKNS